MGNADIKAQFGGKKHELNCNTYQVGMGSDLASICYFFVGCMRKVRVELTTNKCGKKHELSCNTFKVGRAKRQRKTCFHILFWWEGWMAR